MFWDSGVPHHLPFSEGPYVPGCADLMTDFSPDGCFVRLYYPTSLSNIEDHSSRWIPWLAHEMYVEGFSRVVRIWKFIVKFFFWLLANNIHIPVVWNADIIQEGEKLPVIVFSHGLGACRFLYSSTCMELASHGFLVAAIEHRDKSAAATYYFQSEDINPEPSWIRYKVINFGRGHYEARSKQVRQRSEECHKVIDLLEKLNNGTAVMNVLGRDFDLSLLKERLNMTNLTMMGHSFGAATALLTLGNDHRLKFGVILDPWMFPLKEEINLSNDIKQPLLFVNTETFHTAINFCAVKKYTDVTPDGSGQRKVFTIRQTTHENQSDTPYLLGYWLNWKIKKLPPLTASKINHQLILDFLQTHIGLQHKLDTSFLIAQTEYVVEEIVEWKE